MIFNAVIAGKGGGIESEPFAFTYTGDYTDNRDAEGKGTVRLNTSGIFTVLSGMVTASIYILGAGGGAARMYTAIGGGREKTVRGGGGGNQTIVMNLFPNVYEIIIGVGGAYATGTGSTTTVTKKGGDGGYTAGFGARSTGGIGGTATFQSGSLSGSAGTGGIPNGVTGGGNGGDQSAGGDGYIELTFS